MPDPIGRTEIEAMVLADRVHRSVFTDPAVFDLEMTRIFGKTWVYVAHESEIPETGYYKSTHIGRQPVIVVRGKDGQVRVLVNACRHRGTTVCQQACGKTKLFLCAYHGWSYDIDGNLAGVPWRDGQSKDFDLADWGLIQVPRVDTYRGFIFASFDKGVVPLEDHLGNARPFIDYVVDLSPVGKIELTSGVFKYSFGGNWKQQVENSVDGYHPAVTHRSFFQVLGRRIDKGAGAVLEQFGYDGAASSQSGYLGNGHAILDLRHVDRSQMMGVGIDPAIEAAFRKSVIDRLGVEKGREILSFRGGDGFNLLVYPNLILINVQVRVVRPISHDRTEVDAYPALLKGAPAEVNTMRLRSHEDFYGPAGFGAPDDLEMFERQWEGMKATPMEWLLYERGIDREVHEDGKVFGQFTDEVPQRGIWRRWKEFMLAEG